MREFSVALVIAAACGGGHPATEPSPDGEVPGDDAPTGVDTPPAMVDLDLDGLDDAVEQQLAEAYLPYVSVDAGDGCPLDGFVARVRNHPADPTKILIVYDHLFQKDCGLGGHVGDDEVFGIAIDPAVPAPAGILAIRTASHQGTPCERDSECSTCATDPRSKCDMAPSGGVMWPVLYASKDKHGQYATKSSCGFGTCFDSCSLNPVRRVAPVVNVGEPEHHLVEDLTDHGFITAANGWTEAALLHVNPWAAGDFGGAGAIASDLVDPAFEAGVCP